MCLFLSIVIANRHKTIQIDQSRAEQSKAERSEAEHGFK